MCIRTSTEKDARSGHLQKMYFLILFFSAFQYTHADSKKSLLANFEEKFENKISDYAGIVTKFLGDLNDKNLGGTELGKLMHYDEIKPLKEPTETGRKERSVKKMSMAMMPLIFHVGATSTWMLLTALMAAKSVAIGLLLLVFKIAVSSAKVASFFTTLKNKHGGHHHHEYSWTPHYEHGHERSLRSLGHHESHGPHHETHEPHDWSFSKGPEWTPSDTYKTIDSPGPSYKSLTSEFPKEKRATSSYYADSSERR